MTKKLVVPRPTIYYDTFRTLVESGRWITPTVPIGSARYKELIQTALRPLISSQVRVLSPDVVSLVVALVNKAGKTPVPYLPYPRCPLWVEFGGEIGLGDGDSNYKAIWLYPDGDQEKKIVFDLISPDGKSKSFVVAEDGSWEYRRTGTCRNRICERARQTVEGELYTIASSEARMLMERECECAGAGWQWAQLLFLIGHLLRMPKTELKETVTNRDLPRPHNFHARQQVDAENKRYPRYTTLSLSHPMTVQQRRSSSGETQGRANVAYLETQQIAGSWRTLIPGEGKPWKELQLFYVESYERSGGTPLTRYIYEP